MDVEGGRLPIQEESPNHAGNGCEELKKAYAMKTAEEESVVVVERMVVAATTQAQGEGIPDFVKVPKPSHVYPEQNKTQASHQSADAIQEERHQDLK